MGNMEGSVERGSPEGKGGSGWWGAEKEQMQGRMGGWRRGGGSERGLGQYGGANKMLTAVATAPPPLQKKKNCFQQK